MKKILRHLWLLLVGVLITFSAQQARASHAIGGDMSYLNVAPGIYFVQYRFYRDCSGISAPSSFTLTYEATGCGASGTAPNAGGTKDLLPRQSQVGNPYCGRQNNTSVCDSLNGRPSNGFPNYNIYTYAALVNLGATAASECSDWVMSTNLNARPDTRNLGFGTDLYTEVHLNTRLVNNDSSPSFPSTAGFQPLIFTCDTTTVIQTSQVIDPDNLVAGSANTDSLVFSFQRPLSAANTPIAYSNGFTLQNPVRVWTGRPLTNQGPNLPFAIDSRTGTISFTSGLYVAGSTNDTDNKFAVSIQVDSYRKINGTRQKIGSIRRDILVVIFRCPTRTQAPVPINGGDSAVTNVGVDTSVVVRTTDTLTVDACTNATINLLLNDFNGDSIRAYISSNQLPGQASIRISSQQITPNVLTTATATLIWVPDASTVGGYYPVTLRIEDNGCPIPSRTDQPLILHVVKNQYSDAGLASTGTSDTLCLGDSTQLTARTRRPATFGFPPQPAQYNYVWEQDRNNTVISSNGSSAFVKPIETTRYVVRVISPQGCEDTASVRVVVAPVADTTLAIPTVKYLSNTDLAYGQAYAFDPAFNGQIVPNLRAANDPDGTIFHYRIRGTEGLDAFSDTTSTTPVVRNLDRTTTFRLVQFSSQNCVTVRRFTIEVPLIIYNIITPNGDGKNDFFTVSGVLNPEVKIFNRWGTKIEEWANYDNKWNGGDLSAGTYFYYVNDKENSKTYKGWFEIVK
jgi:gliding motility-associated-like protein